MSLEELHAVLQLQLHSIGHDAIDEVDNSGVAHEAGVEVVVVAAGHNNLAR